MKGWCRKAPALFFSRRTSGYDYTIEQFKALCPKRVRWGQGAKRGEGRSEIQAVQKSIAAFPFISPPQANRGPRPRCRHNRGGCGMWVMLRAYALRSLEPAWRQRVFGSRRCGSWLANC